MLWVLRSQTSRQYEAADAGRGRGWYFSTAIPSVFFTSSLSVCFMSFVPLLMHLTCRYSISWFLQTIRRCWTYFKSMCLDWQDTVGKTGLKLSKAMPGQAWLSKITLSVSSCVCFRRIHLANTQCLASSQ